MRETRRAHYLPPTVADDTEAVVAAALGSLASLRHFACPPDAPDRLHLLASLKAHIDGYLPSAEVPVDLDQFLATGPWLAYPG